MQEQLHFKNRFEQASGGRTFAEGLLSRWLHRSPGRQKLVLLTALTLLAVLKGNAQYSTHPITLTGFNADIVANGPGPSISSTSNGVDEFATGYAFMAQDFEYPAGVKPTLYLPASRTINSASATIPGLTFQLEPYNANNALRVDPAGSGTLTFVTPRAADQVCLLIASGHAIAAAAVTYTVTFTDATTQVFTGAQVSPATGLPNWYGGAEYAIRFIGRVNRTSDAIDGPEANGNPRIYQFLLPLSAPNNTKLIQSITFTNTDPTTPTPHYYHVMGVTTRTALSNDAGVASITAPTAPTASVVPNASVPVTVTVKNYGSASLTSATLGFSVDGVVQSTYPWSGSLAQNGTATGVTIGNYAFPEGVHILKTWTENPNGATDLNPSNDTIQTKIYSFNALAGTFTIDKTLPASATNFRSFSDAIQALNYFGISASVTFNVATGSGTYYEQVVMKNFAGSNATKTITFNGNGNTISASPGATDQGIITLENTDYVTFNNFILALNTGATAGWGVQIKLGADNNTISNNTINLPANTTTFNAFNGIVVGTAVTSPGATTSSYNSILNNTINSGYYGISINGNTSTNYSTGNTINGNTIKDIYTYCIYLNNIYNTSVEGNDISRPARTAVNGTLYGIYMLGASSARNTISKNRIHNLFDAASSNASVYGIYFSGTDATAGNENIVKNNAIYNINSTGTGGIYGIINNSSDGAYYYHNTINLDHAANTGTVNGFQQATLATNIKFINNIVSITSGATGSKYALYFSTPASTITSNNNVLYVTPGASNHFIGYYSSNRQTLADWQSFIPTGGTKYDLNSVVAYPTFIDAVNGNLKPRSTEVDNKGQALAAVTDDITGATRTSSPPDPGAYEFIAPPAVTYTWVGGPSGSWTTPSNWDDGIGGRLTPQTNDILQFISNAIVTDVPTQTIGRLVLLSNATVSLDPTTAAATLTINGEVDTDLDIQAGSTLSLSGTGTNGITLGFGVGTTATIAGTLLINASTSTTYLNTFDMANSVTTIKGTGILHNKGSLSGASAITLVLEANATFRHDRDGGGITSATFNPASNVEVLGITATMPTFGSASLGNLIWNSAGQTVVNGSITTLATVSGNFTITSTGTTGGSILLPLTFTVNGNLNQTGGILNLNNIAGASTLNLKNTLNQTGGTITNGSTLGGIPTIVFNGTANQDVTFYNVTNKVNYNLNNAGGMTLASAMQVNEGATLTLTLGLLKLGSFDLSIGATGNILGTPTATKMIVTDGSGQLKKTFAASAATTFNFPIGEVTGTTEYSPVSLSLTNGTTVRTIGVRVSNGPIPNPNAGGTATDYMNRFWTFSDAQAGTDTYSYTGSFTYTPADVSGFSGPVANMKASRYNGSTWSQTISNASSNVLTITSALTESTGALAGSVFSGRTVAAGIFTWTGGSITSPSNWFDASNWDQNSIPGASDNVIINNASVTQPVISSIGGPVGVNNLQVTAGALTLDANAALTVSGNFTAAPANAIFHCSSTFTYAGLSAQTIQGVSYGNLVSTGTASRTLDGVINICGSFTHGTNTYTALGNNTVNFDGPGAITIPAITYNNLAIAGTRNGNVTLTNGPSITIVGGSFSSTATFTSPTFTFVPGTSIFKMTSLDPQTIPAISFYDLDASGGDRILPTTDNLKIAGQFLPGAGNYTVTGSTIEFNGSIVAGKTIVPINVASGSNFHNILISGTGTYNFGGLANGSTTHKLSGNFTQTNGLVNVNNSALATRNLDITGDLNISGGSFRLLNGNTGNLVGATVTATNVNITGSGNINLESYNNPTGSALLAVTGNLNTSTTAVNAIDFGSSGFTVTGNEVRIGGNLDLIGTSKFTTSATIQPKGFVFNGNTVQTLTGNISLSKVPTTIDLGSSVKLASNLTITGTSTVTLNGALDLNSGSTLDLGDNQIIGAGTVAINGTLKTAKAVGFSGAANTALANTLSPFILGSNSTIEYNGTAAQTISARPDYQNLVVSGARGGAALTLEAGTIGVAQTFSPGATGASYTVTGSTVEFKGTTQDVPVLNYNNLLISYGDAKNLLGNITVDGTLNMSSGILQTGVYKIVINGTSPIIETSTSYVTGTVETAAAMSGAGTYSFNGIGLSLTPSGPNFPGNTTVRRVTGTSITAANGNKSIARYFEIVPTTNLNLNVTMDFSYLNHELEPTMIETNLVFFKSATGSGPWTLQNPALTSINAATHTATISGITDFSVWTLADANAPLPVELVAFNAKKVGSDVEVTWSTASEKNSEGYEVQVSTNGKEFHKLGFVESHNGNTLQEYRFQDVENGKSGIRYYRLKQIDFDGKVTYFSTKAVRFDAEKLQLTAYPNPFDAEINLVISATAASKATLKLIDLAGKTAFEQEVTVLKGNNNVTFGLDKQLPAGVYILQAQFGSEIITTRLLKK